MMLSLLEHAQRSGARLAPACSTLGLDPRTVQRWRARNGGDDRRRGPTTESRNKLTAFERRQVLHIATSAKYRDLSPKQIVPLLADAGRYIASESTFYRILREEKLLAHRGRAKAPTPNPPREHLADGPNQVYSWDITYLRSPVRGIFYYLYLYVDVWSRKVVGFRIEEAECSKLAAGLLEDICEKENLESKNLVVHQDNGAPMKGATFKATMERLGITPSFSRPRVSDDNPFSEALFRTLKYRPSYPKKPFADIDEARTWMEDFKWWYNHQHLHSGIGFIAPADRHDGVAGGILSRRRNVYEKARRRAPERWARRIRKWDAPEKVVLNPKKDHRLPAFAA